MAPPGLLPHGLAILATAAAWGCSASVAPSYDDPVPAARIGAIERSAAAMDRTQCENIIESLDDNDPSVRLAAIGALQRLTGETFGYRFNATSGERAEAIGRWKDWLVRQQPKPRA